VTEIAKTRAVQECQLNSLDDVPKAAAKARRQRFFLNWFYLLAGAPIFLAVIVAVKFFNYSSWGSWILGASFAWALGTCIYSLYLLISFRCPQCTKRFGQREQCKGCGLQRHWNSSLDFSRVKELK
jgi:hypothetical protein